MKAGAFDFLAKPFREQELLDTVRSALDADKVRMESSKEVKVLQTRLDTLTTRERQVMELVAKGLLNKQIAGKLGLSEITVKIYRGKGMRKMGATSLAAFLQQALILHLRDTIACS
jgi:FixJ family two-component response regulator